MTSYPVVTSSAAPVAEYPTEEAPSTVTQLTTLLQTITSCAPSVTDCPYGSVTSTVVEVHPTASASEQLPVESATSMAPEAPATSAVEATTPAPEAPATSVADVVTVTVTECPVETPAMPTKPVVEQPEQPHYPVESKPAEEQPHYPTGSGVPSAPVHTPEAPVYPTGSGIPTAPILPTGTGAIVPSKTPVFTGGASINTVSALAFAGVIAAFFA